MKAWLSEFLFELFDECNLTQKIESTLPYTRSTDAHNSEVWSASCWFMDRAPILGKYGTLFLYETTQLSQDSTNYSFDHTSACKDSDPCRSWQGLWNAITIPRTQSKPPTWLCDWAMLSPFQEIISDHQQTVISSNSWSEYLVVSMSIATLANCSLDWQICIGFLPNRFCDFCVAQVMHALIQHWISSFIWGQKFQLLKA